MYNLNVPIKAKDPPWFAVQMGSVADSVAAKIRIIIDNTNFLARKNHSIPDSFAHTNNILQIFKISPMNPIVIIAKRYAQERALISFPVLRINHMLTIFQMTN